MYNILNTNKVNVHSYILQYCDMTLSRDQKKKIKKMLVLHSISFSHVTTKKKFYLNLFKEFLYHQSNTSD